VSFRRLPWLLLPLACASLASGCEWIFIANVIASDDDFEDDFCLEEGCGCDAPCGAVASVTSGGGAPTVDITVADFPPVGPSGIVTVRAQSQSGVSRAEGHFKQTSSKSFVSGGTVQFFGTDLGEGMGTFTVDVFANDGARTTRFVDSLLVDLSPPQAFLEEELVVRTSGGALSFYIGDAWVLSGWTLDIAGVTESETFPPGYPSTLGVEWDYSYVSVPLPSLPAGRVDGTLGVLDAAGNSKTYDIVLEVDGLAPTVSIAAPLEGAAITGAFDISVQAVDDLPYPTEIELFVAGTSITKVAGPSLELTLDAVDFPVGATEITAIATDLAGNESLIATRAITIAHP
jgi:hypothetical protein